MLEAGNYPFQKQPKSYCKVKFAVYGDCEVGFTQESHSSVLNDITQDDDVDTDEEVYKSAIGQCSVDYKHTRDTLEL